MSKILSQEEMALLMNSGQEPGRSTPQKPQGGTQEATRARMKGEVPGRGFRPADRARRPAGWLNTIEGIEWGLQRVDAFSKMSAGRMTFGSLKKDKNAD